MTTLLTGNLPLLADAPKGIQKLRELILELALRGKLVPQDPNEEPASELLKRIAKEKTRRAAKGSARKQKLVAEISDKDKPFEVPKSWEWVSLRELGLVGSSSRVHQKDWQASGVPFYRAREIVRLSKDGYVDNELFISEALYLELSAGGLVPEFGDIMLTGVGTIGVPYRVREFDRFYFKDASVLIFKSHLEEYLDYLLKYFVSRFWVEAIHAESMGTTVHTLTIARANELLCPLPPVAEQRRIVAKVDELMVLCDRLEAQQADAEFAHLHLVQTLLDSLTQAADVGNFAASWELISKHFHTLFTTEFSVDVLKQALLQLAVMGKLVPQESDDDPAMNLVVRIQVQKRRYLTACAGRKQKDLSCDVLPKPPYQVPAGWEWQRVDDVLHVTGGITLGRKLEGRILVSKPYLRVANVQRWHLELDQVKQVEVPEDEVEKYLLRNGDLLITEGGDWDKVGRTTIWRDELPECLHQNHVFRARAFVAELESRWVEMYLNSPFARDYFAGSSKQTTNLASINMTQLRACAFPLPPIAEQQRIIAKFDQLMVLCDQLKSGLAAATVLNEQVAGAVIAKVIVEKPIATASNVIHLSSYIVNKLASRPTFGRTAHMKWLFLADQHLGLELGMNYERQAAGPLDKLIYQIEQQAAQSQLYAIQKETLKSGIEKIVYRPDVAIDRAADAGAAELGNKCAELDRLIGLLGARKTEELEIVATLYAVWNDALVEGHRPDDEWLINEFRSNWHKEKERFSPDLLAKWLNWMREHRLVPAGKTSSTRHQGSLLH